MNLVMFETAIRQDKEGLYSLNDFHKAAGGEERHSPNRWTRTEGYNALLDELTPVLAFDPAKSIRGGSNPGTYVVKELVYAYAMWISPKFHLHVIHTFDHFITSELQRKVIRENARDGYKDLSKALKEYKGEKIKWYHYANEADMINLIVLGRTAKDFKSAHNIKESELLRDYLNKFQIETIEQLQRMDEQLINLEFNLKQRKECLEKRFSDLSKKLLKVLA